MAEVNVRDDESFDEFIKQELEDSIVSLVEDGQFRPTLTIIKDAQVERFAVPDGRQEIAAFFVNMVQQYEGADGYVFITEIWSIQTEDQDLIMHYAFNPEEITNDPNTEEHLFFEGIGFHNHYSGYVKFTHGDDGEIQLGELVMDNDPPETKLTNVAELLKPMVK